MSLLLGPLVIAAAFTLFLFIRWDYQRVMNRSAGRRPGEGGKP
jgi:hypothetical protein